LFNVKTVDSDEGSNSSISVIM